MSRVLVRSARTLPIGGNRDVAEQNDHADDVKRLEHCVHGVALREMEGEG